MSRKIMMFSLFLITAGNLSLFVSGSVHCAQQSSTITPEKIETALRSAFGSRLKPAFERNPYCLTGDFNGDGIQDTAIVVHTGKRVSGLIKGVKVLNPWLEALKESGDPDDGPMEVSELALAIIHGSKARTPQYSSRFLLLDAVYDGPLEICNSDVEKKYGLKFPKKRSGDMIYTGTEDAGGIIYWDGKTYRWNQQED